MNSSMTSPVPLFNASCGWNNDTSCETEGRYTIGAPSLQLDPNSMEFRRIVHLLDLYLVPIIAVFGILGNLVSFLVFVATYLKHMSSSVYLAGLAISDSVFLFVVLISWSNNIGNKTYHQHGWCHLFVYLAYVSSFLSVWFVVCFTVERHIAVCFPLKRQTWCTACRARILVITISVLALAIYSFSFWMTEVIDYYGQPFCSVKEKYYQVQATINIVDTLITLIFPTVVIVVCNIRITYALARFFMHNQRPSESHPSNSNLQMCALTTNEQKISRSSSKEGSGTGSNNNSSKAVYHQTRSLSVYGRYVQSSSYNRLQMKVTKMLLLVSTAFLLCNIPSHAIRVYAFFKSLIDPEYTPSHRFLLVQKVMQFVYYCNFSTNFLLYNISGKAFRRAMFRLGSLMRRRLRNMAQVCNTFLSSVFGIKDRPIKEFAGNIRRRPDGAVAFD